MRPLTSTVNGHNHTVSLDDDADVGVGEASAAPVAACIGNAVFDATGVGLRAVPFTPAQVKGALQAAAS